MNKNVSYPLNEYNVRGAYHANLQLPRSWIARYLRRFHIVHEVLRQKLTKDACVVDIGSGEGVMVKNLRKQGYSNVVGLDRYAIPMSEKMLRGSIYSMPFADEQFDAALCLDVLEHIPLHMQLTAVKEIARVLKPNGFATVSVPNMAHFRSRLSFLITGRPWRNRLEKHPGEMAIQERVEVLKRAGFVLVDSIGLHLTLSYDPYPSIPAGKILSKIMFSPYVPTNLCWTVLLLVYKQSQLRNDMKMIEKNRGILRKALASYQPGLEDPTSR